MEAQACVLHHVGGDFAPETVRLDQPRDDEVLVRIQGVGLCHTDLVVQHGDIPFPMPAVLGHEGAGVIEQAGSAVSDLRVGDTVVLSFSSCGACAQCAASAPAYCENFGWLNFAGARPDGSATLTQGDTRLGGAFFGQSSFATYALARANGVVRVDSSLPTALLGPLGCGVQTGAGAVMNSLACTAGSSLLVTGGGAVGLSAVLGAVVQGCTTIIVVEPHRSRRELARELGATHVIDPADGPLVEAVRAAAPKGVNFALDTTARPEVIEAVVNSLAVRGVCGLVGAPAPGASLSVPMAGVVGGGRAIRGIIEGDSDPKRFIPRLLQLQAEGRFPFDRLITTYPMAQINEAVAAQNRGECVKAVLTT